MLPDLTATETSAFLCVLLTAVMAVAGLAGCAPYPKASSVDVCNPIHRNDIVADMADTVAEGQFVSATRGHNAEFRNLERRLVVLTGLLHTTGCFDSLLFKREAVAVCIDAAANAAVDPGPCYGHVPSHSLPG